jgi:hypothetical protein
VTLLLPPTSAVVRRSRVFAPSKRTLFDWENAELPVSKRVTALDRRFVIEALRDIYRLSGEPHIRRIADDVLFAHRIPTEEEQA